MTKREKALILKAKQDLESVVDQLESGKLADAGLLVLNVKNVLGRMLGETSELES